MFSSLRIGGLIILFAGFVWLCLDCFIARPRMRPVIHAHFQKFAKDENRTFVRRDIMTEIHDVAEEVSDAQPSFLYPGCVMLVGSLILAFAPPRHGSDAHI